MLVQRRSRRDRGYRRLAHGAAVAARSEEDAHVDESQRRHGQQVAGGQVQAGEPRPPRQPEVMTRLLPPPFFDRRREGGAADSPRRAAGGELEGT